MSLDTAIALAGVLLAYAGAIGALWGGMGRRITKAEKKAANDFAIHQASSNLEIRTLEKQLNEFKIKVTEDYASWDTVRAIETRLTERMDSLSEQVMKMPDAVAERLLKYMAISKP